MVAPPIPGFEEHRNDGRPRLADLPACPVETTAQLIGSKWRLLIMRDLLNGPLRFGELRRSVSGISQKVLTSNLRNMEGRGLVVRRVYPEVPPHVESESPRAHVVDPACEKIAFASVTLCAERADSLP